MSEVAALDTTVTPTGLSNAALSEDTSRVIEKLDDYWGDGVASSMSVAGMITLARNVRVLLKGASTSKVERQKLVEDGAISAGVAGLMALIMAG